MISPSLVLWSLLAFPAAVAQGNAPSSEVTGQDDVRLVVLVALDQMIPEQLERLEPWFTGGLGRFAREGRVYTEAALDYAGTETGPGHASYGTGYDPLHHGLVGNSWRETGSRSVTYCVADADSLPVTDEGPQDDRSLSGYRLSPRNLRRPGLADRLKAADPLSRCVSISSKDRAAIGTGGQHPDLALWWSRAGGGFISSTWYVQELPPWVRSWNAGWLEAFQDEFGDGWHFVPPADFEGSGTAPDDREGEVRRGGRRTFPYPAPELSDPPTARELASLAGAVYGSPAGDSMVLGLAREAVEALELGGDEHVDLLVVSLSATDTVGHYFGPYSWEVTDVILRADRGLGELFELLDERVGKGRWIASLSSDHGVLPLVESLNERGIEARRVSRDEVGATLKAVQLGLEDAFGEDLVLVADGSGVMLSREAVQKSGAELAEVRAAVAELARDAGGEWLAGAFTWDELRAVARGEQEADGVLRLASRSFDEERSPDVVFESRPWLLIGLGAGTSHGTANLYDRRIPLAFLGPGFPAGKVAGGAGSIDVVPTVLARLGLPVPDDLDGRVLGAD